MPDPLTPAVDQSARPADPPPPASRQAEAGSSHVTASPEVATDPAAGGFSSETPGYDFTLPGVQWSEPDREALDGWSGVFTENEIPAKVGRAAVEAYSDLRSGTLGKTSPHQYRIPPEMGLTDADKPYLDYALGKFAAAGASESQVWAILRNFQDARAHAEKKTARGPVHRPDWNRPAPQIGAVETELAQIEKWMRAPRQSPDGKKYWGSESTQARYRELLTQKG